MQLCVLLGTEWGKPGRACLLRFFCLSVQQPFLCGMGQEMSAMKMDIYLLLNKDMVENFFYDQFQDRKTEEG
jgi:hypothetical protein